MANKNSKPKDEQLNGTPTTSIVVPKYPFDEHRTETDVISWETMMRIAMLWGCAPGQVKKQQSYVTRCQAIWGPDDFGLEQFKAKVNKELIKPGHFPLGGLKKLTIHQIIYLVDKQLSEIDHKEREQDQTQWKSELRKAYETALDHKEHWQQRVREAIALVKQWYQDYFIEGKEVQQPPFPYMEDPHFRIPNAKDLSWMYWVLGMKFEEIFGISKALIPDDVQTEMVDLWPHIEKPIFSKVLPASLEDFKTYWGYVARDIADLAAEKSAETEQKAIPTRRSKIGAWLWKLYEKTLKVVFDAILDKMWPK